MEEVSGIGGVFIRVLDVEKMSEWYRRNLGIRIKDGNADFLAPAPRHPGEATRTAWALFPADSDYFGPARRAFMINYRVPDMARMLAQLEANDVVVEKVEDYDYGKFAWITDPEGNRIELWEPKEK